MWTYIGLGWSNDDGRLDAGEPIDVAKVAVDLSALPLVTTDQPPDPEYVQRFVDAFFDQLEWVAKEPVPNGSAAVESYESGNVQSPASKKESVRKQTGRATVMDLSVLDAE
ncbi:MAG: hypothetical protein QM706_12700 [Nitrospira sp.]